MSQNEKKIYQVKQIKPFQCGIFFCLSILNLSGLANCEVGIGYRD